MHPYRDKWKSTRATKTNNIADHDKPYTFEPDRAAQIAKKRAIGGKDIDPSFPGDRGECSDHTTDAGYLGPYRGKVDHG